MSLIIISSSTDLIHTYVHSDMLDACDARLNSNDAKRHCFLCDSELNMNIFKLHMRFESRGNIFSE